jgi:hypothetical protein
LKGFLVSNLGKTYLLSSVGTEFVLGAAVVAAGFLVVAGFLAGVDRPLEAWLGRLAFAAGAGTCAPSLATGFSCFRAFFSAFLAAVFAFFASFLEAFFFFSSSLVRREVNFLAIFLAAFFTDFLILFALS